ncbi:MAG: hypothetical protein II937_04080 [Bacteroidales bacterium]|nr:hypothetical protein [Bacteroidales bacterium]
MTVLNRSNKNVSLFIMVILFIVSLGICFWKDNEKGILHLLNDVDGSKKIYDGDFNVYDKKNFMNTDKQCVVFPKDAKNIYLEPMFEYAPSGRIKRYNPNTYQGRIV